MNVYLASALPPLDDAEHPTQWGEAPSAIMGAPCLASDGEHLDVGVAVHPRALLKWSGPYTNMSRSGSLVEKWFVGDTRRKPGMRRRVLVQLDKAGGHVFALEMLGKDSASSPHNRTGCSACAVAAMSDSVVIGAFAEAQDDDATRFSFEIGYPASAKPSLATVVAAKVHSGKTSTEHPGVKGVGQPVLLQFLNDGLNVHPATLVDSFFLLLSFCFFLLLFASFAFCFFFSFPFSPLLLILAAIR